MRIVVVVQPWRFDYYNFLAQAKDIEWILLWYEKPGAGQPSVADLPLPFKQIIYWQNYRSPQALLREVKPDRILFFEIIDLRQIALIVSAAAKQIPTYYSDHGAAADKDATLRFLQTRTFRNNTLPYLLNRLRNNFSDSLRSKLFYFSVTRGFQSFSSYIKYLLLPFKMLFASGHTVLLKNRFKERVPKVPMIFNQPNLEDFETYTGINKNEAYITGVPFFDGYYREKANEGDYLVYIDHPYYEEGIAGWTLEHHRHVARHLFEFVEKRKVRLFIKLHPRSDRKLWDSYSYNKEYIQILQAGDFTDLYLSAQLILGYSSSLINGFLCAKKNVVVLGWNPEPHIEGADFSLTGLCHASLHLEDLMTKYDYWISHNLAVGNEAEYRKFLMKFNYPYDGRATERIIRVLLDPEDR